MRSYLTAASFMIAALSASSPGSAEDGAPKLSLPIACELGKTCFVQNYADIDSGPGLRDFACGSATYDGHKGTDFRVPSAAAATEENFGVLAAAGGIIRGMRDGMPDVFIGKRGRDGVSGRECGNGVVIDHGNGWETQYCHMLRGSVLVKSGEAITRGQRLGRVGYSGFANFAHVHLEVRHHGQVVDPFSGSAIGPDTRSRSAGPAECSTDTAAITGLWDDAAAHALKYAKGEIIKSGFTGAVPDLDALELDDAGTPLTSTSQQLVMFARLINLSPGDQISLSVTGPEGFSVDSTSKPIDRAKATYMSFAGKKLSAAAWPTGKYEGLVQLLRAGAVVAEKRAVFDLEK